jgi:hypothetical protein
MSLTEEQKMIMRKAQTIRQIEMFDADPKDSCPHLIRKKDKYGNKYVFCNNTFIDRKTQCWATYQDNYNIKSCQTAWKIENPVEALELAVKEEEEEEYCKLIVEEKSRELSIFKISSNHEDTNKECPYFGNLEEDDHGFSSDVLEMFSSIYYCDHCWNPTNQNDNDLKSVCSEENCPFLHPEFKKEEPSIKI